eukprot:SAG22_NODE_3005_length_2034_cov_1.334884_2_plen_108_part_00
MNMNDRSTEAMLEGCQHCSHFILFLSGDRSFADSEAVASDEIVQDEFWARFQRSAREIGTGSQGSVFEAKDRKTGRLVAIKVVKVRKESPRPRKFFLGRTPAPAPAI